MSPVVIRETQQAPIETRRRRDHATALQDCRAARGVVEVVKCHGAAPNGCGEMWRQARAWYRRLTLNETGRYPACDYRPLVSGAANNGHSFPPDERRSVSCCGGYLRTTPSIGKFWVKVTGGLPGQLRNIFKVTRPIFHYNFSEYRLHDAEMSFSRNW